MKKENIYKILYVISVILLIAFVIILGIDYFNYDKINNSAPFYVCILVRILEFVVPSIIIAIIAKVVKKKFGK